MALEIKHLRELMDSELVFNVPSYQRGYRWERKQIERLLDDLLEFSEKVEIAEAEDDIDPLRYARKKMGFLCLQPLVVSKKSENKYDVIDGQQRLTTIYLILNYLCDYENRYVRKRIGIEENLYSMQYESRDFEFFKEKKFTKASSEESQENIDFYFLTQGYETVKKWFEDNYDREADEKIYYTLLPLKYDINNPEYNSSTLNDVRFIWYEIDDSQAIDTFNNLNYGKIGLTASELVKALLFQCDEYENANVAKAEALSRSNLWSIMESELHDEFFWSMLASKGDENDLRLELILRYVAWDIYEQRVGHSVESISSFDSDWLFNEFSDRITEAASNGRLIDEINSLWDSIVNIYGIFRNWYTNRELYHKIGFLVCLKKDESDLIIRKLYKKYTTISKPEFISHLNEQVRDAVEIHAKKEVVVIVNEREKKTKVLKKIDELSYEGGKNDKDDIRKILLLFNVMETLKQKEEQHKFPFHLADKLNSLEHIHPQHMDEDFEYQPAKQWFGNAKEHVEKYILPTCKDSDKKKKLKEAINYLEEHMDSQDNYNSDKQNCLDKMEVIDSEFDELVKINPEVLHSLRNMALVDGATNSALQNYLLDEKRSILAKMSKGDKDGKDAHYVPIGTWQAFNKYYSKDVKDMKFWSEADRNAYYEAVKTTYNNFFETKTDEEA